MLSSLFSIMLETLEIVILPKEMHIFRKSNFSRSMFKGIGNDSKNNGLGGRKGFKNQRNLDART